MTFFTVLQHDIVQKLKNEESLQDKIKEFGVEEILNVNNATASFDNINNDTGKPTARLTIIAEQFKQPVEISVEFEFKDPVKACGKIAEQLLLT